MSIGGAQTGTMHRHIVVPSFVCAVPVTCDCASTFIGSTANQLSEFHPSLFSFLFSLFSLLSSLISLFTSSSHFHLRRFDSHR